jgi:hypothetical protein
MFVVRMRRVAMVFASLALVSALVMPLGASAQGNSGAAHLCQKGGWESLARREASGTPFTSQDECVSYAAEGGILAGVTRLDISIGDFSNGSCLVTWTFSNAPFETTVRTFTDFNNGLYQWTFGGDGVRTGTISEGSYITGVRAIDLETGDTFPLQVDYPTHACGSE